MVKNNIITSLRKYLSIILYLAILIELCFFPSWANFCGCLMALICWLVFSSFFLKRNIIVKYPFAFTMYLSMFMYRYLPLIATLIEGKPITYGLQLPYYTFFLETLLFLISSLAFHMASNNKQLSATNNYIQRAFYSLGFFSITSPFVIWSLGFIGLTAKLYLFTIQNIEYGDIDGKFLSGITYLMYVPLCLFFPALFKPAAIEKTSLKNKKIWIYWGVLFILSLATNSRQAMLAPIATIGLLFLLYICKYNIKIQSILSPIKLITFLIILIFGINFLSDISLAMLYNRGIRSEVSKSKLLKKTMLTLQDKELMQNIRKQKAALYNDKVQKYSDGWNENYIDNFVLNRYCNIRITDQTLYYALRIKNNKEMIQNFSDQLIAQLPTPLINKLGFHLNKKNMEYSRGDLLYAIAAHSPIFAGYRVTSHVADGIATFGLLYFPIQFFLFWGVFKLLNSFVYYDKKRNIPIYSIYALASIFTFLGMFRNANGCLSDISYILRRFLQDGFTFAIILFLVNKIYSVYKSINLQK